MGLDTIRQGATPTTQIPGPYSMDYSKILQEMMKMTGNSGNLLGDKPSNPGHGYFPDNFKNM